MVQQEPWLTRDKAMIDGVSEHRLHPFQNASHGG
jgi:hypothetical protein